MSPAYQWLVNNNNLVINTFILISQSAIRKNLGKCIKKGKPYFTTVLGVLPI